jgi:hypothetical protein
VLRRQAWRIPDSFRGGPDALREVFQVAEIRAGIASRKKISTHEFRDMLTAIRARVAALKEAGAFVLPAFEVVDITTVSHIRAIRSMRSCGGSQDSSDLHPS